MEEMPKVFRDRNHPLRTENREPKREAPSSFTQKLVLHLTGFKTDDVRIIDKLIADKVRLRAKYQLPPLARRRSNPQEYEKELRGLAQKYKTQVRSSSESGEFFQVHPYAHAAHVPEDHRAIVDLDKEDRNTYALSLGDLEHELIHAMQSILSPRMPIELQEYEAYIAANFNYLEDLKNEPNLAETIEAIFWYVAGSVDHWYSEQSKKRGEDLRPEWEKGDSLF